MATAPRRAAPAAPPPPPPEEVYADQGPTLYEYIIECIVASGVEFPQQNQQEDDQAYFARILGAMELMPESDYMAMSEDAQAWYTTAGPIAVEGGEIPAPDGFYADPEEAADPEPEPEPAPARAAQPAGLAAYREKQAAAKAAQAAPAAPAAPARPAPRPAAPAPAAPPARPAPRPVAAAPAANAARPAPRPAPGRPAAPAPAAPAPGRPALRQAPAQAAAPARPAPRPAAPVQAQPAPVAHTPLLRQWTILYPDATIDQLRAYAAELGAQNLSDTTLKALVSQTKQTIEAIGVLMAEGQPIPGITA